MVCGHLLCFDLVFVVQRNEYDPRIAHVASSKLVTIKESRSECGPRELNIEYSILLCMVLALYHRVVQRIRNYFLSLLLEGLLVALILLLGIWLVVDSCLLLALMQEVLEEIGELHFDEH